MAWGYKTDSTVSLGTDRNVTDEIRDMIKQIDLLDDDMASGVADALRSAGEVIANKQRQLISGKSAKLASLIRCTEVKAKSNKYKSSYSSLDMQRKDFTPGNPQPSLGVYVGYNREAIEQAPESVIMEFGKPSKNKNRGVRVITGNTKSITINTKTGKTYKRSIKESLILEKNGMKVDSKGRIIGYVPSINHIRKGFDMVKEQAYQVMVKKLDEVLKQW